MSRHALLLVNRNARRGAAAADGVVEALAGHGIRVTEESSRNPKSLPGVILRHKDDADLVVVGGGDGTLNAAADGLVRAGLPLGVVPLGTANDLARTLGLPDGTAGACRVIAEGHSRRIDLGSVNGKHFFNVASLGLSVDVTERLSADVKRAWGVLAYAKAAAEAVVRARPFRADIEAGGRVYRVRTVQIAVGNGRHYGGGMTVAEDAEIDDNSLDLYSLEVERWWQVFGLIPSLRSGSFATSKYVRTLRGPAFTVTPRRPRPVNTDGELTERSPAEFRVVPRALEVFVPRPAPSVVTP